MERGAWGVAAGLKQPGRGVQRQVSCPPALKSFFSFPVPTVSFSELRQLLASGRARLFDVRSREEAAAGTIPGALNIPGIGFPLLAEELSMMVLTKGASFSTQWGWCVVDIGPYILLKPALRFPRERLSGADLAAELAHPV